jgi:hypothetical protein
MARGGQNAERIAEPGPAATPLSSVGMLSTSYEVQIFRDKRWRIDSMFDDKSLALYEARRMNDSGRYVCVRVVEEYFDEATGQTRLTTVYRGGRIEQAHQKDLDDSIKRRDVKRARAAAEMSAAAAAPAAGLAGETPRAAGSQPTLLVAIMAGIIVVLAGAVGGLLLFD